MIVFWIAAALLSAAAAALVVHFAGREPAAAQVDPAALVYRRHLEELDVMAERGLISEDEKQSAYAEAARRLLAADAATVEETTTKGARMAVLGGVLGAAVLAMAIYLLIGNRGMGDQPFKLRTAEWEAMAKAGNVGALDTEKMAVLLKKAVAENPGQAEPLFYLARAQLESGQLQLGIHNLRKAIALAPDRADLWGVLGEALTIAAPNEMITPEARAAFQKAVSLDPKAVRPRFYLAKARIAGGDVAGGLADWRALASEISPTDPQRQAIEGEIARVEKNGSLIVPDAQPQQPDAAMIEGMVASLAAKLKENPDDVQGWARLIRSYAVLGDRAKMNAALEEARRIFKDRPSDRAAIESAAERPQ